MNIFNKIYNHLKPEGLMDIKIPIVTSNEVVFGLFYENLLIGKLKLKDNKWQFVYSDDFKNQSEISPLGAFPSVDHVYQTEELWPFFASRIPTPSQPVVRETIAKNNIDPNNTVAMLTNFGKRTITNPFELRVN